MYRDGEGVPQDIVKAHMWFNLASVGAPGAKRPSNLNRKSDTDRDWLSVLKT